MASPVPIQVPILLDVLQILLKSVNLFMRHSVGTEKVKMCQNNKI